MEFDLKLIGMTQDELQQRVVSTIADAMLHDKSWDEDGNEGRYRSAFRDKLAKEIQGRIDEAVKGLTEEVVGEALPDLVKQMIFKRTNRYGERNAEDVPFCEYIAGLVETYLMETVREDGKSGDSYGDNSKKQARIAWLVDARLKSDTNAAVKRALGDANKGIAELLKQAVCDSVAKVVDAVQVEK